MKSTEHIWSTFNKELFAFIRHSVKDEETSKDVLQDVFFKIHTKRHTLKDEKKLVSWVWQITRNTILDHYKTSRNLTDLTEFIPAPVDEPNFNGLFALAMKPFIGTLPEPYRGAIIAVDIEGISQKDYAEKAGISYTAAKSRVQRARKQLKNLFQQCCEAHADIYGNIYDVSPKKNCTCQQRLNDHYLVSSL